MSVAKIIELVGQSEEGWDHAVKNAVAKAGQTVEDITGVEVLNQTARVDNGEITQYKVNVKLLFGVRDDT